MNPSSTHIISKSTYPFGMAMKGRSYEGSKYKYGFNTQEKDDEPKRSGAREDYLRTKTTEQIYGEGNSTSAEYWQYDSRLGRRWNVDPVTYPWNSSYSCFNGNPIFYSDPNGLEPEKKWSRLRRWFSAKYKVDANEEASKNGIDESRVNYNLRSSETGQKHARIDASEKFSGTAKEWVALNVTREEREGNSKTGETAKDGVMEVKKVTFMGSDKYFWAGGKKSDKKNLYKRLAEWDAGFEGNSDQLQSGVGAPRPDLVTFDAGGGGSAGGSASQTFSHGSNGANYSTTNTGAGPSIGYGYGGGATAYFLKDGAEIPVAEAMLGPSHYTSLQLGPITYTYSTDLTTGDDGNAIYGKNYSAHGVVIGKMGIGVTSGLSFTKKL